MSQSKAIGLLRFGGVTRRSLPCHPQNIAVAKGLRESYYDLAPEACGTPRTQFQMVFDPSFLSRIGRESTNLRGSVPGEPKQKE